MCPCTHLNIPTLPSLLCLPMPTYAYLCVSIMSIMSVSSYHVLCYTCCCMHDQCMINACSMHDQCMQMQGVVGLGMVAVMMLSITRLEVPALARGSVSFEHPRAYYMQVHGALGICTGHRPLLCSLFLSACDVLSFVVVVAILSSHPPTISLSLCPSLRLFFFSFFLLF